MMKQEKITAPKRSIYLDVLRIIAVFFVIVNHTNSSVFQGSSPEHGIWYASMLWYYLSKIAVPLFVMVSGACLLPKVDSYAKVGKRIFRMVITLVVFSYFYFLYDAMVIYGIWPRAIRFDEFFSLVWQQKITNSFWYLYFYIGLLTMLPPMQRLAQNMKKCDLLYLIAMSFGLYALCPLISHFYPALTLPYYFDAPMFSVYIGLFFAGHYMHQYVKLTKKQTIGAIIVLFISLGLSLLLTYIEYGRVAIGENYWFMDDLRHPSILTIVASLAIMAMARSFTKESMSQRATAVIIELGGCSFCMFLLQDFIIKKTKTKILGPLVALTSEFPAALIWELLIFALALAAAYLLRKIPLLKKLL